MRKPPLDCSATITKQATKSAFAPNGEVERFYEEIVALNPALESLNDEQLDSTSTWVATAPGPICSLSSTPLSRRHGHGHAE